MGITTATGLGIFLVTHFEDDYNTLYRNRRDGTFAVASAAAGLAEPSLPHLAFGTCFLDYDNDQDQDLFVANGHVYPQIRHLNPDGYAEPNQLFANEGPTTGYRFAAVAAGDLSLPTVSRGAAKGDCDNDGDVDLLVFNLDGPPSLLRNDSGNQLNWLSLLLVGTCVQPRWHWDADLSGQRRSRTDRRAGQRGQLSLAQRRARPLWFGREHPSRAHRNPLACGPRPAPRGCGRESVFGGGRAGAVLISWLPALINPLHLIDCKAQCVGDVLNGLYLIQRKRPALARFEVCVEH